MLVDVFSGLDRNSATLRGSFYFARSPEPGERVEIEGAVFIVTRTWHQPDNCYRGAKFAILVEEQSDRSETVIPIHDDAVALP